MFGIEYRFTCMILLAGYSFLNALLLESFEYYPITTHKLIIFLLFIVLTIYIWEGNRILDLYIAQRNFRQFWKSVIFQFGGSLFITFVLSLVLGSFTAFLTLSGPWQHWILPLKLLLMFSLRTNLFLNTIHLIFVYHQKLKKSREELEIYKRISSQAQLQSLKNQVNPHFLFNNLSVLSALIPTDAKASVEFVRQFSRVYRYVLKSHEMELIELSEELGFIEAYLYLLKTRFESGISIKVNVPPSCLSSYIVPISIQMLVENTVKHNIVSRNKPLKIEITSSDGKSVTVRNNYQPKMVEEEESTKTGLRSIARRYEFLGYHSIKVHQTEEHFSVTIPLIGFKPTDMAMTA